MWWRGTGNRVFPAGIVRRRLLPALEHDDGNPAIAAAKVGIGFQRRLGLQQSPGLFIGLRPVLAENAGANLGVVGEVKKAFLHGDADVAPGAGRTVAMNQFQYRDFFLAGEGEFAVQDAGAPRAPTACRI
jgi:hypothetical protein